MLDAFIKLMRAAGTLQARVERRLHEQHLTETQFGVLEILLHLGSLTPGELSRKQFSSCGNITLVLDNLERRTLVRRERSATDRRSTTIHLTSSGRAMVRATLPIEVAELTREFASLTPAEQRTLGELCKKLGLAVMSLPERTTATRLRRPRETARPRASSARRGGRVPR